MPKGGVERHNAATRKLYDKDRNHGLWQFCGVDGEGGNVPELDTLFGTRHQYLSLRAGADLLETGEPLSWYECLGFIADLPPRKLYVSYFFDYDVTMIIRTMPKEKAFRLLNPHLRHQVNGPSLPVDIGDFQIDYLPHKEFKVRRKGASRWVIISDVGQFFQGTFLSSLDKWDIGTPEEREFIRKGKSMRADFAESNEEIRAYNALECLLLEQMMTEFRAVCEDTGYVPRKWQGPGYLASAMLDHHGIPRREDIKILENEKFRGRAQAAYYGGRFETTATGPIRNPVWQYDINSAYPSICRGLPCLSHGTWREVSKRPDRGTIWFGEVYFNHPTMRYLYNLPCRLKNGNIFYPKEGNGVYWGCEIEAAERAGTNLDFRRGWAYESHCECRWFDFVDSVYAQRQRVGKSAKGIVLKLALNSIYGKLAQSIGYAPYANPVWAGLITAGCRAMLIDAYSQAPEHCYMLATDGIFMGKPIDLPLSNKLGDWEGTYHADGMFIVQPGIYFIGGSAKTRGVERGRIHDMRDIFEIQFRKYMDSGGINHTVSVDVTNFITAKQAISRNKWGIAGTWEHTKREVSFDWSNKRKGGIARLDSDGVLRTWPHHGATDLVSVAYERQIGGGLIVPDEERYQDIALQESMRMQQQPDWVQPMFGE